MLLAERPPTRFKLNSERGSSTHNSTVVGHLLVQVKVLGAVLIFEMADRKREREENEIDTAVQELEASLGRDTDLKLKALQTLRELVDLKDEGYTVQRQAAEAGILAILMQLLEDDAESVRVDAAKALTAITRHSTPTLSRLDVGKTIGFSQTPEKVNSGQPPCMIRCDHRRHVLADVPYVTQWTFEQLQL